MMFGVCHILGMSSTCTTPILYAFLNNSFRYQQRSTLSPITRNTPAPQSLPNTYHVEMREV